MGDVCGTHGCCHKKFMKYIGRELIHAYRDEYNSCELKYWSKHDAKIILRVRLNSRGIYIYNWCERVENTKDGKDSNDVYDGNPPLSRYKHYITVKTYTYSNPNDIDKIDILYNDAGYKLNIPEIVDAIVSSNIIKIPEEGRVRDILYDPIRWDELYRWYWMHVIIVCMMLMIIGEYIEKYYPT